MRHLPVALAALLAASPLLAQAGKDLPPLNTAQVLRELEQAEKKQRDFAASRQRET